MAWGFHGRRHTGMVDESKEDLMAAYKLDPNNKAIRKELQLLKVLHEHLAT